MKAYAGGNGVERAGVILISGDKVTGMKVFDEEIVAADETRVEIHMDAFDKLEGSFVPFHTHLGHPETFTGVARFAPTAEDIAAHQVVMLRYAASHNTSLQLPGVIYHAGGEVTFFWAPGIGGTNVRFSVRYLDGRVDTASADLDDMERACVTGVLPVTMEGGLTLGGKTLPAGTLFVFGRPMDLWDRRKAKI
jgi:hypothetical protein